MDEVRRHYIEQIKLGRILTTGQLMRFARKHNSNLRWDELSRLKAEWLPTAVRRKWANPKTFQTISHPSVGRVQIDFALYCSSWKNWNSGYVGFLAVASGKNARRLASSLTILNM